MARDGLVRYFLTLLLCPMLIGCGSAASRSGSSVSAGSGEVERTRFDAALDVDLGAMTPLSPGLLSRDVEVGTGAFAAPGREVRVRYVAYLATGREVDRSASDEPSTMFTVGDGRVIRGWDLGVRGMRVGGTRQLVMASRHAYGNRAVGDVPARSVMVFVVRLESVR